MNNAALTARLFQERLLSLPQLQPPAPPVKKIAILDVDYHCGNGTASIFYNDPNILVVSIHCHPDYEYPFHSGYRDETGGGDAKGCTLHLPLLPGATWKNEYETALKERAGKAIVDFNPDAFVLSLGLDTHVNDPCVTRRAGFRLIGSGSNSSSGGDGGDDSESDYFCMGRVIGDIIIGCSNRNSDSNINRNRNRNCSSSETTITIPTIVLQEGGYEMKAVPSAAADVLLGMATIMSGI